MLGLIDSRSPLPAHPLNRGLLSWWLPIAPTDGGRQLYDIAGGNHGTLTNGPTWAAGPTGFPAVDTTATGYVSVASGLGVTGDLTISVLIRQSTVGSSTNTNSVGAYQSSGGFVGWGLDSGGGMLSFWDGTSWRNGSAGTVSTAVWQLHTASVTGSTVSFYVNGQSAGSSATTARSSYPGTYAIGARSDGGNRAAGLYGGVFLHNRGLPGGEVAALYDQCLRGHPDTLPRLRGMSIAFLGSSATVAQGSGSADGSGVATGAARSRRQSSGSADGTSPTTAAGRSRPQTLGSAAGTCTVTGMARMGQGNGVAAGTCTVTGGALTRVRATATAAGTSPTTGSAQSRVKAEALATGAATADGRCQSQMTGTAAGSCTVSATGQIRIMGSGTATGSCAVSGVGRDGNAIQARPFGLLLGVGV